MLPPKRTVIGGQKHELAYINKDEKALLRSRGGGVTPGGGQLKHNGVNAFGGVGGGPPSPGPSRPPLDQWQPPSAAQLAASARRERELRLVGAPPVVAEVTASLQRRSEAEARNPVTTTGVSSTAGKRKKPIGVLGDTNTATGVLLGS
jgi:hypothetical protein